jgi:hypothetical protein
MNSVIRRAAQHGLRRRKTRFHAQHMQPARCLNCNNHANVLSRPRWNHTARLLQVAQRKPPFF